jgi:methyl-accepting chemotaxis protein
MKTTWYGSAIGLRIGFALSLLILANIATIAAAIFGFRSMETSLAQLVSVNTAKSDAIAEMRFAIAARVDHVRNIALTSDVDKMKVDQEAIGALIGRYSRAQVLLATLPQSSAESALLVRAGDLSAQAEKIMKDAQAMAMAMQAEPAAALLTEKLAPLQVMWLDALEQSARLSVAARSHTLEDAAAARRMALRVMVGVGLLALLAGSACAYAVARSIARRLEVGQFAAQKIAEGDLTTTVLGVGNDEVAKLLRTFEAMQLRLRNMMSDIMQSTAAIHTASADVAQGSRDLSARTGQHVTDLKHAAAAMQQVTQTVSANAQSARQANEVAAAAAQEAERGGAAVKQVVVTMSEIEKNSSAIADITGVIEGIAFQTNILALNAAVEAARAGEQGRGFAVVASEVRTLASRASQAAKEIKTLISASLSTVDRGAKLVNEAGSTMNEILSRARMVATLVDDITHSSMSQTSRIGEVNVVICSLDKTTQQNALLVEHSAAAADSLKTHSNQLSTAVSVFRVKEA